MKINPSFDPIDRVWYTDDGIIAKTIRELLKLLPKNTTIPNYHPQGYNGKLTDPLSSQHKQPQNPYSANATQNGNTKKSFVQPFVYSSFTELPIQRTKRIQPVKERIQPDEKLPSPKRYFDHDQALNLWLMGLSGPAIAQMLGVERVATVTNVIWQARKDGDPRAIPRMAGAKRQARARYSDRSYSLSSAKQPNRMSAR